MDAEATVRDLLLDGIPRAVVTAHNAYCSLYTAHDLASGKGKDIDPEMIAEIARNNYVHDYEWRFPPAAELAPILEQYRTEILSAVSHLKLKLKG
jgi:hypothetical protein